MKKGFTLIELLAVILILGIIALIAIPTVNKIINEARYGAFKSGNDNIMKTIEQDCQTSIMKNENPILSYIFTEGKSNVEINVKGELPTDGYILLDRNCSITDYYLTDNKNIYSNGDDVRKDYMLKAPSLVDTSIFKTLYPDYYSIIRNVNFINNLNIPENAIEIKDPSISEKGKIKSWLVPNGENYDLYVGSNKKIFLNYDSKNLFKDLLLVESFNFNNIDTSFTKYMNNMFSYCKSLISIDLNNWNTSNTENMKSMFSNCSKVQSINISNWDTRNVISLGYMFHYCLKLEYIDVSKWNTSNLQDLQQMFFLCGSIKSLNLTNWDLSNIQGYGLQGSFQACSSLTTLGNISNWDIGNAFSINNIFQDCHSLITLNLSNWDISNVKSMQEIFRNCYILETLDLSNWNFNDTHVLDNLFENSTNIKKININSSLSVNKLSNYIIDRTENTNGTIIVNETTGIDITKLNLLNWNIYDKNGNLIES